MDNKKKLNVSCEVVSGWEWAWKAALKTEGKLPKYKMPTKEWRRKILMAEHSPIRNVSYYITIDNVRQWVTTHLVRHFIGFVPFVHSQRSDRRELNMDRDELPQGSLNDMSITANAQSIINVSRKRLCGKASKETRECWKEVKETMSKIDPDMALFMVPNCIYRGFCPEMKSCGYSQTEDFKKKLSEYRNI